MSLLTKSLVFVGAGNMASALMRGAVEKGGMPATSVWATDINPVVLESLSRTLGIHTGDNNVEAVRGADIVVLATKPVHCSGVLTEIAAMLKSRDALLISVCAGVSTELLESMLLPQTRVVRSMPNTPAMIGRGTTAIARGTTATDADIAMAQELFNKVGVSVVVDECMMDTVTGLSGSGPAYVFRMIESMTEGGVRMGLPRDVAYTLAKQTVRGAGELCCESEEDATALRERVTSPNGTTQAGLEALEEREFMDVVCGAVRCASLRSKELGDELKGKL